MADALDHRVSEGVTLEHTIAGSRAQTLGRVMSSGGIFVVVAAFALVAALINSRFLQVDNVRNVLQIATPIAVLALGQAFVLFAGHIDLSVGSIVSISAAVLGKYMGVSDGRILPVVLLALALGGALGALNGGLVAYLRIPSFIATLGTLLAISGAQLVWTQGAPASNFAPNFNLVSQAGVGEIPTATLAWLAVAGLVSWLVAHRTTFGRRLLLIGSNQRASELARLPVQRTVLLAYVLSGAFAAAAAVYLTSTVGSAQDQLGAGRELDAIAACVLGGISLFGGRGRIVSALGGALLLGGLFNFLVLSGAPFELQQVIKGVAVIVAVIAYARLTRRE